MEGMPRRRYSIDAIALANAKTQQQDRFTNDLPKKSNTKQRRYSMAPQYRRSSIDPSRRSSIFGGRRMSAIATATGYIYVPTTFSGLPLQETQEKFENTYKLEPDDGTQFRAHVVTKAVNEVIDDMLPSIDDYFKSQIEARRMMGNWYTNKADANVSVGGKLAKLLVTEVKDKMKTLDMKRYKFVVNAFVGDSAGQRMLIASKSLMNNDTDGHVTVQRQTSKYYAVVVVHALYFE